MSLLLPLLALSCLSGETAPARDAEALRLRVAATLDSARDRSARPAEGLVLELAECGPAAIEPLFAILESEHVPAPAPDGGSGHRLSSSQRKLIVAAFGKLDADRARAWVERCLERSPSLATRRAAIEVLGAAGEGRHLDRILALAVEREEGTLDADVEESLGVACGGILERHPETFDRLPVLLRTVGPRHLPALVRGVGAARNPRGLPFLTEVLDRHPDLASLVLSEVQVVGRSGNPAVDEALALRVRTRLDPRHAATCLAAMLALGELHDYQSISDLVGLLDSDQRGIRENAHRALRRISGLDFPAAPERWTTWHEEELRWRSNGRRAALRDLESRKPGVVSRAVLEIGQRRLFRDQLAQDLVSVLQRPEPKLRTLACKALGELGSVVAVDPLRAAAADQEPEVADAARASLLAITGRG